MGGIGLETSMEKINNNLVVALNGELDHHTAKEVREEIDKAINRENVKNIVFDFKKVKFMDSSGIGVVIGRFKKIREYGGQAGVINLNNRVHKIFKMSGLFNIIKYYETKEEALENL
jgi:stage II sporulation protein AA (anti-sigma F factor antagonist)